MQDLYDRHFQLYISQVLQRKIQMAPSNKISYNMEKQHCYEFVLQPFADSLIKSPWAYYASQEYK